MLASDRRPLAVQSYWDGLARLFELNDCVDGRGSLVEFDFRDMPFSPGRSFVIHGVPHGKVRGGHAHVRGQQLLCCLAGTVTVEMRHAGEVCRVELSRRTQALLVTAGVWAEQHYSGPEALLLVLASHPYDVNSYVYGSP